MAVAPRRRNLLSQHELRRVSVEHGTAAARLPEVPGIPAEARWARVQRLRLLLRPEERAEEEATAADLRWV